MPVLKRSRQREAIKEFLMTREDHPTADTVYQQLRKTYPNISLGTVYRNLALLADIGEIQRISTGDSSEHYDGKLQPHYHVICTKCGRITDIDLAYDTSIEATATRFYSGKIQSHITNFYGVCEDCLSAESEDEEME